MTGPLAILRSLARPLAALAVVLTLMATVVPTVARGDGAFCLGAGDAADADGVARPLCEACVLVALPCPAAPALPDHEAARPASVPAVASPVVSRAPEAERIRGPPAL